MRCGDCKHFNPNPDVKSVIWLEQKLEGLEGKFGLCDYDRDIDFELNESSFEPVGYECGLLVGVNFGCIKFKQLPVGGEGDRRSGEGAG